LCSEKNWLFHFLNPKDCGPCTLTRVECFKAKSGVGCVFVGVFVLVMVGLYGTLGAMVIKYTIVEGCRHKHIF
jgi:hypothetical protein